MKPLLQRVFHCQLEAQALDLSDLAIHLLPKQILSDQLITQVEVTMTPSANPMVPAFRLVGLFR